MKSNIMNKYNDEHYTPIRKLYARIGFYTIIGAIPFAIVQYYAFITIIKTVLFAVKH